MPYSWIAIAVLTLALGGAGWVLKNQIGENARLEVQVDQSRSEVNKLNESIHQASEIDKQNQEALKHAKSENDKRMADVAGKRVRLYIPATCMPTPSTPSRLPDAEPRAELAPEARSDYSALIDGIDQQDLRVKGLQDYITKVCLKESST